MTSAIPNHGLERLVVFQVLLLGLGAGALTYWCDSERAASFAVGAGLMLVNALALAWGWWRVIAQKRIAWTALIIVIKYAVLLSTIFYLTRRPWFHVTFAGLGIASFLFAVLLWAVTNPEERDSIG